MMVKISSIYIWQKQGNLFSGMMIPPGRTFGGTARTRESLLPGPKMESLSIAAKPGVRLHVQSGLFFPIRPDR